MSMVVAMSYPQLSHMSKRQQQHSLQQYLDKGQNVDCIIWIQELPHGKSVFLSPSLLLEEMAVEILCKPTRKRCRRRCGGGLQSFVRAKVSSKRKDCVDETWQKALQYHIAIRRWLTTTIEDIHLLVSQTLTRSQKLIPWKFTRTVLFTEWIQLKRRDLFKKH